MFVLIVTSSKGCLYEEVYLQIDTMFHNRFSVPSPVVSIGDDMMVDESVLMCKWSRIG
jgi:hypothetical protein